jgi:superfamily II DNA/RNA helicase
VLSPTRELSAQILDSFRTYGRHLRISSALAIGGVSMGGQVRSLLNGVDILIATPGRLLDLLQSNGLRLDRVECLVLDEADRMLDMGFIRDIKKIVAKIPKNRQTLFFSATMPQAIAELAGQMLRSPVKISVAPVAATADRVEQRLVHVDRASKPIVLAEVLKREPIDRVLVFTRTKHGADKVVRGLIKAGIAAEAIHGNKSQNQRARVLAAFRTGQIRTLVATDIAARGIDVDGISHVVNYDLPDVPESYVHRIGRTARAGAEGIAISFCSPDEKPMLRAIERLIRLAIPVTEERVTPHAARHAGAIDAEGDSAESHGNNGHGRGGHRNGGHSSNGHSNNGHSNNGHGTRGRNANANGPGRGKSRRQRNTRAPEVRGEVRNNDRAQKSGHEMTGVAFLNRGRPGDRRTPR